MADQEIDQVQVPICKDTCNEICRNECTADTLFSDCKTCPRDDDHLCNAQSFKHVINEDINQCPAQCINDICTLHNTASQVLEKCSSCPATYQGEDNETHDVKCHQNTKEYELIKNSYVSKLHTYNNNMRNAKEELNRIPQKSITTTNKKDQS